jgi:hypothetical protein
VTCERQPRRTGERAVRVDPLERVAQAVALLALLALPAEAAQRVRLVDVRTCGQPKFAKHMLRACHYISINHKLFPVACIHIYVFSDKNYPISKIKIQHFLNCNSGAF